MLKHRTYRRLRVLLAFLLVPLVLFANPNTAQAATSGIMNFQLGPAGLERFSADCRLSWTLNSGGMVIGSTSRCDGGPDLSPGFCQPFEGDCGSYGLVLKSATDATCGSAAFSPFSVSGNATVSTASGLGGGYIALNPEDCEPVQACLSYYFDPSIGSATDEVHCIPIDLDLDAPPSGASCPAGTPHAYISVERVVTGQYSAEHNTYLNWSVTGNTLGTARQWGVAMRYTTTQQDPSNVTGADLNNAESKKILVLRKNVGVEEPVTSYPSVGMQVYAYIPEPPNVDLYWNRTPVDGNSAIRPTSFPLNINSPYYGITDASQCRFYFGPKTVDDPTSDMDEPFGDADDPNPPDTGPNDPEPVVDPPEIVDPGPDFNWLQAIWAVLKAILGTIGSLAKAIVDGLLSGIKALFIPDRTLASRMDELDGEFEDRFPFNVADSLGEMGISAGGGSGISGRAPMAEATGVGSGGCPDWKVIVEGSTGPAKSYDAVCDSSFTSAIRGARPFILAGLLVAAFWPLIRGLFFASVPVIKPVPTDGK